MTKHQFDFILSSYVHSIAVHPTSSAIITAATGGGLYRSADGGATWKNLYPCYIRAMWVDPEDPQHITLEITAGMHTLILGQDITGIAAVSLKK